MRGEEMTAEAIKKQMTDQEWQKVYEMSQDKNLYHNLITSLFPTIHGEHEIRDTPLNQMVVGNGIGIFADNIVLIT